MPVYIPDWRERIVFSPEGPQPQVLTENVGFKAVLAGLEPGQKIPVHPEGARVFYFLEGSGSMQVEEEHLNIHAGAIVVVPAGAPRGIEAQTRVAFIAVRAG